MNPTTVPGKDKPPHPAPRPAAGTGEVPGGTRGLPERPRIVLIRFTSLGDVVKATTLPRLIKARYPGCHLTMVTAEVYLPLIAHNPHVDRAIGFPRREGLAGLRRLARRLRAGGVDLVADMHRSLRSRLLARWLGAPGVRYSKRSWQRWLLVRFGVSTYRRPRRKEEDFAAALAPYGIADDGRGPEIFPGAEQPEPDFLARLAEPLRLLAQWRQEGRPVLGLAPVAAWGLKRWPLAHFRCLAERFVWEAGGAVLVFGGAGDRETARAVTAGLAPHAVSLAGETTLLESARFAALADAVVCNDTGMAHLAEAAGRDVIVLFGPTSRELGYFPARPGSRVLERDLPCRPCTRMGEGRCTHPLPRACLALIDPETVLAAVRQQLAQTPAGAPAAMREASC